MKSSYKQNITTAMFGLHEKLWCAGGTPQKYFFSRKVKRCKRNRYRKLAEYAAMSNIGPSVKLEWSKK